ncbi:MAG: FAD-binding domain-containing protein, partial [Acidihalobacter sp.]
MTDAAPYFRAFNQALQSRKFYPEGRHLRQWLPELVALPDKALHAPLEFPPQLLRGAGIRLGVDYPTPLPTVRKTASVRWPPTERSRMLSALLTVR